MTVPQRALLVLPTTAEYDSRTYRIASGLAARGHEVTVLARWKEGLPEDEVHEAGYRIVRVRSLPSGRATASADRSPSLAARLVRLPRRLLGRVLRNFAIFLTIRAQRNATRRVAPPADLVHGMAYMGVPIALDVARRSGAKVVYDARDIYLDAANLARLPRWLRWLVGRFERRWARSVDRILTVNRPYAEVMARRWGIELPLVVMNCSYRFTPPEPPERRFHEVLVLPPDCRVVLYQGGFSRDRGIEQLIEAIRDVPNANLVLLGYGVLHAELEAAAADPRNDGRVHVLPAVAPTELLSWVAAADVVAMPIQPTTLNHRLTTPNKLFEAMAAGVPVVASDLPGMAPIVRETGCGVVCDPTDPSAIAAALRRILEAPSSEREAYRARALAAAHGTYNWERQLELLVAEYGRLTGKPW